METTCVFRWCQKVKNINFFEKLECQNFDISDNFGCQICGFAAGTENSDQARDTDLPLKERFYLQPLPPSEAAKRAKESAKEILNVKQYIDKKAWPYLQNDLRSKAGYLRFDLNTVISAKPKDEKKSLKELTGKLFQVIGDVS